jgi:imidazole glycerol phosphate synthase subunit HisF
MFIMVRRGQCDNPTKVRNVQSIGGAVALIADYQEESLEDLVMEQTS